MNTQVVLFMLHVNNGGANQRKRRSTLLHINSCLGERERALWICYKQAIKAEIREEKAKIHSVGKDSKFWWHPTLSSAWPNFNLQLGFLDWLLSFIYDQFPNILPLFVSIFYYLAHVFIYCVLSHFCASLLLPQTFGYHQ